MRSFWSDPYLWIHLAGSAALPIFLEICFLGLAVGDPILPIGLELLLIAVVGITPIVWMQWQRPFYIFSLVAIALKPEQLTPDQRKLLRLFKAQSNRVWVIGGSVALLWVLSQLYRYAPIASEVTPWQNGPRGLGLLIAAIAFLACNLFLQVPLSVASVLLTRETTFAATEPYPLEQIPQNFTLLGLKVKRILPEFRVDAPKPVTTPAPTSQSPLIAQVESLPVVTPSLDQEQTSAVSVEIPDDDDFADDDIASDDITSNDIASDDTDAEEIVTPEPVSLAPLDTRAGDSAVEGGVDEVRDRLDSNVTASADATGSDPVLDEGVADEQSDKLVTDEGVTDEFDDEIAVSATTVEVIANVELEPLVNEISLDSPPIDVIAAEVTPDGSLNDEANDEAIADSTTPEATKDD
ncbi:MAG: low-complexity tail membrane protein [Oculatellaceae cyanobacterium bins.114]|nr:low-complexity tail membrane protein [Oculatellaceae cyanobacterium bins.114]